MIKRHKLIVLCLIMSVVLAGCGKSKTPVQSETSFLMDTVATISIYDKKDKDIINQAFKRTTEVEDLMSKTIAKSDISNINKNAGEKGVKVSEETYNIIKKALEIAEKTDGAFDPSIGPLVELWNIKETEDRNWIPTEEEIEAAKTLVNYKDVELSNGEVKLLKKGMKLDLGGIAKGYGADEVRKVLEANKVESAIIDLGGNIFAMGSKYNDEPWNIGIKNPDSSESDYIGIVGVEDKTVVTSGGYERYFKIGDEIYHHIIEPETGYPAKSEFKSVTIVGDNSMLADALSTSIYILGLEKGKELISSIKDVDVIFLTTDDIVYVSKGLKDNFVLKNEKLQLKELD